MKKMLRFLLLSIALLSFHAGAQQTVEKVVSFKAVPELPYRVIPNFFKFPKGTVAGEASAVAVNSKGHIFLFQRVKPMLAEFDAKGNFIQSIGEGLFSHPYGVRIDAGDNLWTTDDGNHLVLKLDPSGNVLLAPPLVWDGLPSTQLSRTNERCGRRERFEFLARRRLLRRGIQPIRGVLSNRRCS